MHDYIRTSSLVILGHIGLEKGAVRTRRSVEERVHVELRDREILSEAFARVMNEEQPRTRTSDPIH